MNAEVEAAAIAGGAADRFVLTGEPGTPWQPSSPQRLAIVIIGLILASIVALSAVVVVEALDSRVRGAGDIRRLLGRSPLAVVPEIHNSVYWWRRMRRVLMLGGATVVAAPVIYFVVQLTVN
jgi:nitric oxide reductase large subunit